MSASLIAAIRKLEGLSPTKIAQILRKPAAVVARLAAENGIALAASPTPQKKPSSAYARHATPPPAVASPATWATDGKVDAERFGGYQNGVWVAGTHRVPFRRLKEGEAVPVAQPKPSRVRTKGAQPVFGRRVAVGA